MLNLKNLPGITRNQIINNNESLYVTVPVIGARNQIISEVLINDLSDWRNKQIKTLSQNYRKHPYGEWTLELIKPIILNLSITKLSTLNITIIKEICKNLNINSNFYLSSNIPTVGFKSYRLVEICKHFNIYLYYSPLGSKKYINEEGYFEDNGINVIYQNIQSYQNIISIKLKCLYPIYQF